MKTWQQVILGVLMALISAAIIVGSISLSLAESGIQVVLAPTLPTDLWTPIYVSASPGLPFFDRKTTPTLTPCPLPPGWVRIEVQADETLAKLARFYGISIEELRAGNCLVVDTLFAGLVIGVPKFTSTPTPTLTLTLTHSPTVTRQPMQECIKHPPPSWVPYIVQPGDSFSVLSRRFNVDIDQLMDVNCYKWNDVLRAGAVIYVPNVPSATLTRTPSATPISTIPVRPTTTFIVTTRTATTTPTPTPTSTVTPTGTPTHTPLPATVANTPLPTTALAPSPTATPSPTLASTSVSTAVPAAPTNTPLAPNPTGTSTSASALRWIWAWIWKY